MMSSLLIRVGTIFVFGVTLTSGACAQSSPEPPVRTTYPENGMVKERWFADAGGAKNGKYVKYSKTGKEIESDTYVHGILNGPAFYIDSSGPFPSKYVGTYTNGKKSGTWLEYGFQEVNVTARLEYNTAGVLFRKTSFTNNKLKYTYTLNEAGYRNGPAKIYEQGNENIFYSGNYVDNKLDGVWSNAALDKFGELTYAKGYKVTFENGVAVLVTDNAGNATSLKDKARRDEALVAKSEADRIAASAAVPKRFERITGIHDIAFTTDSYLLTEEGQTAVTRIANQINERAGSDQKVRTIYLSAHCAQSRIAKNDSTDKMLFILSLNRAFAVGKQLQEKLNDKTTQVVWYGCGGALANWQGDQGGFDDDTRVQMVFDDQLPKAQRAYSALADKYAIKTADRIVPNDIMRRSILRLIPAYFEDEQLRQGMVDCAIGKVKKKDVFYKIPRELWVTTPYSEKYGERNPEIFKREVETLFSQLNKKYDLMSVNQGKGITPAVLFEKELEQYIARTTN
jgi:antitoxin component YwqK of YwqJK toxin-antitoxin module